MSGVPRGRDPPLSSRSLDHVHLAPCHRRGARCQGGQNEVSRHDGKAACARSCSLGYGGTDRHDPSSPLHPHRWRRIVAERGQEVSHLRGVLGCRCWQALVGTTSDVQHERKNCGNTSIAVFRDHRQRFEVPSPPSPVRPLRQHCFCLGREGGVCNQAAAEAAGGRHHGGPTSAERAWAWSRRERQGGERAWAWSSTIISYPWAGRTSRW